MAIQDRFKAAFQSFTKTDNSNRDELLLSRKYLKYGQNKPLVQDWSRVIMSDEELYKGYPYAAINNRANGVANLAESNLKTDALPQILKDFKAKQEEVMHPYLDVIDESLSFDNNKFWYDISTYLDLEGVYYLMVLRNSETNEDGTRTGNVQEFKLLNPYDIRRIVNDETLEIGGYVETRDGLVREFPPEMIIEIRKLNPFSANDPFSMTDAAKESQYTLKQAGDYTRHSLKNNMAAPGIISTDVLLDPQQFSNFVSRVTNQEKGLPLFGNGAGAVTWDSMQIDMDKAALDKINEINRQALFAVSGVGKTMMSIEESGTTRDTARAQKEIFIENHVMPQLKLILSALNQDYKRYYMNEYKTNKYKLYIDNPLGSDRAAELQDVEIRDSVYKTYDTLVAAGYTRDLAARYASGEITLEELGEPTEEPRPNPIVEAAMLKGGQDPTNGNLTPPAKDDKPADKKKPVKKPAPTDKKKEAIDLDKNHTFDQVNNEFDEESQGIVNTQQGQLQNSIIRVESEIVSAVLNKVTKNAFDSEDDVIDEKDKLEAERELKLILETFYTAIIPVYASKVISSRLKEFGGFTTFKLSPQIKEYIKTIAEKTSKSHVDTVVKDLMKTAKETYDNNVESELKKITDTGRSVTDEDLVYARKRALEGASRQRLTNEITNKFQDISKNRAKAIARTETNRAFTRSQFEADLQFIKQNGLEDKAFKKWTTRSEMPCVYCNELASRPPIPFKNNFLDLGDELSVMVQKDGKSKVQTLQVNFESLEAGNAHVNCSCIYVLIIK